MIHDDCLLLTRTKSIVLCGLYTNKKTKKLKLPVLISTTCSKINRGVALLFKFLKVFLFFVFLLNNKGVGS